MKKLNKQHNKINFGNKVWSSDEKLNSYPWALVGVEGTAELKGNKGGIDTFSGYKHTEFSKGDCCFCITVGDMKSHDENGNRLDGITPGTTGVKGNLTIDGGVYKTAGDSVVYVANGTCLIKDGIFFAQPSMQVTTEPNEIAKYGTATNGVAYRNFLLNLYDSFGNAGEAEIIVEGGTFIGFDPAYNFAEGKRDGEATNFVKTGYKSVENGTYTYRMKKKEHVDNGKEITVKVYTVVPSNDERKGIEGIK